MSRLREFGIYWEMYSGTFFAVSFFVILGAFLSLYWTPISSEVVQGEVVNMTRPADYSAILYVRIDSRPQLVRTSIPDEVPVLYGKKVTLNQHETLFGRTRYEFVGYSEVEQNGR